MANEITIDAGLQISNGTIDNKIVKRSLKFDQTGKQADHRNITLTATGDVEIETHSGVGTNGWSWFRNHASGNYCEVGPRTATGGFLPMIKMKPGEPGVIRLATGVAIYGKANTASVPLEYWIAED